MGVVEVKIWNVTWRDGRPRFTPGPKLRRLVGKGFDLRHENGAWYTLDEAGAWAKAKKAEVEARRAAKAEGRKLAPIRRARGLTVSDLFEEWYRSPKFTGGVARGKRNEKGLSVNSMRDYRGKAKTLLIFDPDLAGAPPAAVSDAVAQGVYESIWEAKGLHTANGVAAVASSCWDWAGGRGLAGLQRSVNPWKAVKKTSPDPRVVVLEDFEVAAWIAACDLPRETRTEPQCARPRGAPRVGRKRDVYDADGTRRPELGDAIMLGLFTGQRQSDRLGLLDRGRDDKGRRVFEQDKTSAIVAVPETPALAARLAAAAFRRKEAHIVAAHVILDERTKRPFKADHYRHLVAERREIAIRGVVDVAATEIARASGRDPEPVWLLKPCPSLAGKQERDLRDTAVTWLARAGATVMEIAAITGHSLASIHNVLKHYLALHPDMADAAIGKLVKWMEEQGLAV